MPTQEQLNARSVVASDREERLTAYLRSLPERRLASGSAAAAAEQLWLRLHAAAPDVAPPNCVPMEDGGLRFSWIKDGRYLDAEIDANGRYEWFFRDRAAGITADGDATVEDTPAELLSRLRALYP